jgi:hypothetical protein
MKENEDRSPIAVTVDSDGLLRIAGMRLTATQADALIALLADQRAQMDPPVSPALRFDELMGLTTDPAYVLQEDLVDKTLMVALRHVGLGWCGFEFTREVAAELRDELAHFAGPGPAPTARAADGTPH